MLDIDLLPQGLDLKRRLSPFFGKVSELTKGRTPIGATPSEAILEEGSIRVLKYLGEGRPAAGAPTVLIIPSLINRHYILDLLPGKSFVEHLVSRKFQVFMLEWLPPEDEDRWLSFERLIAGRLRRAIECVLAETGDNRIHLIGHCLGGTLALVYGLRFQERMASLTLLTAPVDFEKGGQLAAWTRFPGFHLETMLDAYGNMPWPAMQAAFQLLKPASGATKYLKVLPKLADRKFIRNFLALELWAMDNMSFPGGCYRTLIQTFYRENQLARGRIRIAGKRVALADISFPVLSISSDDDHIAPPETALSCSHAPDAAPLLTLWRSRGGHIGCLLGRRAQEELWPRLSQWISNQSLSEELARAP